MKSLHKQSTKPAHRAPFCMAQGAPGSGRYVACGEGEGRCLAVHVAMKPYALAILSLWPKQAVRSTSTHQTWCYTHMRTYQMGAVHAYVQCRAYISHR